MKTLAQLKIGQKAQILDVNIDTIPLKLLEMGCLPGNFVELLQIAPLGDPLYIDVNDSHVAIRKETALAITVEVVNEAL
ncbi:MULTISPECIES: FeoA family protein [Flavobacterium]|uniref:Ferrous iron transport protein A n=1 Tax=Flavobacterium lindanitolerans TaxID=428988 RepID=A0A497V4R2_9FLAO|nr:MULTISPECIES: FeoA family protein [Flavobacterium]MBU7569653.1 ferrous iron transport protein A [Flavobacterium sp.]PZO30021.1 MAG: ferrous iron transport protein A [Flavobacteriaceae bacterium]PZQ91117.1 MAG: ferrous iron transport protein A [Flavobacterium johnsoniae]KQS52828.1 iron transporter [Flavobacterium sp. Leaf359]MBC8643507.1 ferrous iron transport protein A [Flavobacterium lindanitolerans]